MKVKNLASFFLFGSFLLSTGCSEEPQFSFFCERDKMGNYTIKWEVSSEDKNNEVSIYMSENDSLFAEPPVLKTKVNDYIASIPTQDPINRKFFRLKVKNTFSGVITNRFFKLDSLQNFRDVGGYYTREGKQVKWGKLYRSGELSEVSSSDAKKLDALKIKTIVDFRDNEERELYPSSYKAANMVNIPMRTENRAYIREKIIDGSFLRGDALIFTQDAYKLLVENYAAEFAKFFDILCDENNYPIIFQGYLGKDRVGLANYFLLRALGIPSDINEEEYLLSNSYINEAEVMGEARFLPEQMQEAATVICQSHLAYLNYAKTCMIRKSGSVDEYMVEELKLTAEKKEKLREILLYR
ncbi:MAG: tyrosine-protein phosphatase [Dysgonomonas sp.]|nr:tyrosine-protein phosphatase [Dysgonomonas sp.]